MSVGTTVATGASTQSASEQFNQNAVTAAQATDAERALVISRFEESEHQETTRRTLRNENECYAVTYYVRRVNEVYASTTRVASVEWQQGDGPVRALDDLAGVPAEIVKLLKTAAEQLPRPGEVAQSTREIALPTDGTLYEAELAHCSSCEPTREEATRIQLEQQRLRARRICLENELLALELERRRAHPDVALELGAWTIDAGDTVGSGEPADR